MIILKQTILVLSLPSKDVPWRSTNDKLVNWKFIDICRYCLCYIVCFNYHSFHFHLHTGINKTLFFGNILYRVLMVKKSQPFSGYTISCRVEAWNWFAFQHLSCMRRQHLLEPLKWEDSSPLNYSQNKSNSQ